MTYYAEPLTIRSLELSNRIFMAPMCQYSAAYGIPNDWHMRHYTERALGGVALVVIEATAVAPEGRISPADLGLWNDAQKEAFKPLVKAVHAAGAKVAVQLAHAGRKASTKPMWLGKGPVSLSKGGWTPVAPSAVPFDGEHSVPVPLDSSGIAGIVRAFGEAAERAMDAGFDAVEIHAAHGYLAHQFLSPITNQRNDGYGGGFEGRIRFVKEVVQAVRKKLPETAPLLIRVSATDWLQGGWDVEECARMLNEIKPLGVDFVDVSSGGLAPGAQTPIGPGYQVRLASRIREATGLLTGAVGLITTAEQIEQILLGQSADAVSLGRLLLRDPYWPIRNLPAEKRRTPPQYQRGY